MHSQLMEGPVKAAKWAEGIGPEGPEAHVIFQIYTKIEKRKPCEALTLHCSPRGRHQQLSSHIAVVAACSSQASFRGTAHRPRDSVGA